MNAIASFRICTLSDNELLEKIDRMTDEMYKTQKVPCRHIPAQPNDDFDLLIGELLMRFKEKISRTPTKQNVQPMIENNEHKQYLNAEVK